LRPCAAGRSEEPIPASCYDREIDNATDRATRIKRLLTLTWHTLGYWAVAYAVAGFAGRGLEPLWVLGAFAVGWLIGLAWAAVRRKRTVLVRVVGLLLAALPIVGSKVGNPQMTWVEFGDWFVLRRPDRFVHGLLMALGLFAIVALLQVLFARAIRKQARRRGLDPVRPGWHAFVFPIVFAAALLIVQLFPRVALLVLCAGVTVWIFGLLGAVERRETLTPRWIGLALAVIVIGGWPPVPLDAFDAEIAVAVLRYEMADADGLCFVEVRGEDPSADVLRGLADLPVRVRPASAAVYPNWIENESARDVTDRDTGETGVVYSIASIRRSVGNPMTVEVGGSTYSGPLAAGGGTYYVAWLFGHWVVVDYDLHWVS
jgi:hypothetical protein